MIIYIYDVTKYGSCMIDDSLFEMIYYLSFWNDILKLLSFPVKKDCADRPFEITYFSSLGQHNLLKDFLWFPFWNDIWLSFRNEQCVPIFILKCFMTVILKWGGKIFVHKIIFVRKKPDILLTKIPNNLYFFVHRFLRKAWSLSLRWNKILEKGDGLLCQILIILQC